MSRYFDPSKVDATDARAIADAAELQLIVSGDPYLSYAEYRDLHPAGSEPSAPDVELGLSEVSERVRTMGRLYPFTFDGQGVRLDRTGVWQLYAFLLILSLRGTPFRHDKAWKRSDPLFDAVVMHAFGANYGRVLHFGWPPRGERPATFPEALMWAAEMMDLKLRSDTQPLPTHRQDGGVDVIAWSPYADGSDGFPVVLVQNTVQHDYVHKPGDIDPNQWRDWIVFGNTPGTALAVPFLVPQNDPRRPQLVSRLNDFMDRARIMESLGEEDPASWPEWAALCRFVDEQVSDIRTEGDGSGSAAGPPKTRRKKARPPRLG